MVELTPHEFYCEEISMILTKNLDKALIWNHNFLSISLELPESNFILYGIEIEVKYFRKMKLAVTSCTYFGKHQFS